MRARALRSISLVLVVAVVLLAATGCGTPDDAKARVILNQANARLRGYAASTNRFDAALQRYSQEIKKGGPGVGSAMPELDAAQSVLTSRSVDLSVAAALLAQIDSMRVSSRTHDTATALRQMVVLAQRVDVKLVDIVATLRDRGTYVASGGKDIPRLRKFLDRSKADIDALKPLYRQLGLKQAEVSKLMGK